MTSILVFESISAGERFDGSAAEHAALQAQGVAMRDALAADLLAADCAVSVAVGRAGEGPRGTAAVHARPGETLLDFAAREAARHDAVWLIAPECAGALAAYERALAPRTRWIGCGAEAIAVAASKQATTERLHSRGVPTPRDPRFGKAARWVLKPDDGAGACDTRVVARDDALAAAADCRGSVVAEPWVDGEAMSLALIAGPRGARLLAVNRQRIEVDREGGVHYAGVEIDVAAHDGAVFTACATLAQQVAEAIPALRGFVGIDFVQHPVHGAVAIEVNPRLTSAYVGLSRRLGTNIAALTLEACGG